MSSTTLEAPKESAACSSIHMKDLPTAVPASIAAEEAEPSRGMQRVYPKGLSKAVCTATRQAQEQQPERQAVANMGSNIQTGTLAVAAY